MNTIGVLDKTLPEPVLKALFDLLKEVSPKHIDEVGFLNGRPRLLLTVFPALKSVQSWYTFEESKEWLAKSMFVVKERFVNLSQIRRVKVYSEEVQLEKEITVVLTKPYNFFEDRVYMLQTLGRGRWVVRGKGKPTLERLLEWEKIIDTTHQAFRIRIRLPNGVWFSAFCASQPGVWLKASIRYLKAKEKMT